MNYLLETNQTTRVASIENGVSNVFYANITADFHTENSVALTATAAIYEEAIMSGAGKLDRETFLDAINSLGASLGVSLSDNKVTFSLKARALHAKKLLSLFELMIKAPQFASKEISRIKVRVTNEIIELKEEARYIALSQFQNQLFGESDRRYNYDLSELQKALQKVTKKDLEKLHARIVQTVWAATVGTDQNAIALFIKTLRSLKQQTATAVIEVPHEPKVPSSKLLLTEIASKQNIEFSIGGPLPMTIHHPDYIPFVFGLNVLGKWGGFTGRLMSTVREKEGLTYGIYARSESVTGTETGYWRIMTFFNPTDAERGLTSTFREIKKIAKNGITDDEFVRFKNILATQQTLLADSYSRSLDDLHSFNALGLSLDEMQNIKEKIKLVSQAEVNAALKKYLVVSEMVVSGAGPIKKAPKSLSTFTPGK